MVSVLGQIDMRLIFCSLVICVFLFSCKQEEPKSSINLELKKELGEIFFADQAFRTMTDKTAGDTMEILAKRMLVDTTYLKSNFISLAGQSDARNSKRIEEIIKEYGYPGKSIVGVPENHTAWTVIQHSKPEIIEKYLPLLRRAVQTGDLEMQSLALTEDRNLKYQGKAQIYGSQFTSMNGKTVFWPIQNPDKVDELRKESGFVQSIQEYGRMVNGKDFVFKNYTIEEIKKLQNQ